MSIEDRVTTEAAGLLLVAFISLAVGAYGAPSPTCEQDCPTVHNPICASNNKTYDNDCSFTNAQCGSTAHLTIVHRGLCGCPAFTDCPDTYQPVCGSDNNDYPNSCHLEIANNCRPDVNITILRDGPCIPNPRDPLCQSKMICAAMYSPVCGRDDRTYGNACLLQSANVCRLEEDKVSIKHSGECTSFVVWMAVAITAIILLVLVLICCVCLLRKNRQSGARRYEVHRTNKEEL